MKLRIQSAQTLGLLVRATRKSARLRQDDTADSVGVGHVFLRDVEHGKQTVQLGKVLHLLDQLGIHLYTNVAPDVAETLNKLQQEGLRPLKSRRRKPAEGSPQDISRESTS